MCLQCHQQIPDEVVVKQMKEAVENPQYEKWNVTSISHISIAAMGTNGEDAKKLARELLDKYIEWKNNHKNDMDGTFFGNSTSEYVVDVITEVDKKLEYFKQNNMSLEDIKHHMFGQLDKDENKGELYVPGGN